MPNLLFIAVKVIGVRRKDEFIRHLIYKRPVTICIAAICNVESNPTIVFCADHLITGDVVQFEATQSKTRELAAYCYAMQAGDALVSDMILENVKEKLDVEYVEDFKLKHVADLIKEECCRFKESQIEKDVLSKYRLIAEKIGVDPRLVVRKAIDEVNSYSQRYSLYTSLQFIIAAFDPPMNPHLYVIDQDGNYRLMDSQGYACIGSGAQLADLQITKSGHSNKEPVQRTISLLYFAKKVSERTPGVGKKTDLFTLNKRITGSAVEQTQIVVDLIKQEDIVNTLDRALEEIEKFEINQLNFMTEKVKEGMDKKS